MERGVRRNDRWAATSSPNPSSSSIFLPLSSYLIPSQSCTLSSFSTDISPSCMLRRRQRLLWWRRRLPPQSSAMWVPVRWKTKNALQRFPMRQSSNGREQKATYIAHLSKLTDYGSDHNHIGNYKRFQTCCYSMRKTSVVGNSSFIGFVWFVISVP